MNDLNEMTEHASTTLSPPGVGHLLAEAREAAGLSLEEAATQLRLSPRQVAAIESGELEALPGPAFVRGFVRNYAKLLQIDAEPLLEAYKSHMPGTKSGDISLHSENILISGQSRKAWVPYFLGFLLLIAALVGWVLYSGDTKLLAPAPSSQQPTAITLPPAEPALPMLGDAPTPSPDTSVPATEEPADSSVLDQKEGAATAESETGVADSTLDEPPAAAAGKSLLEFQFSQASWVSVRDKADNEIYNKTMPAGSSDAVQGEPPFSIVIGNVEGTKLSFNGKPVDLAKYDRLNVARMTLQ